MIGNLARVLFSGFPANYGLECRGLFATKVHWLSLHVAPCLELKMPFELDNRRPFSLDRSSIAPH